MRLGIFSDVHANLEALQAVLQAYQEFDIDRYVCLGDTVGYGANPNECCKLVQDLTGFVVMGNHDAACSGRLCSDWFNPAARAAVEAHQRMLEAAHMSWLAQLPYRIEMADLLFCHGSPYRQEEFPYILDETDIETLAYHVPDRPPLIFVGHTHRGTAFTFQERPTLRVWEDPRQVLQILPHHRYVLNVGSVGQPRDGDWRASYAIFDTEARTFELRRTEYDVDAASEKIECLGLPLSLSERLFLGQ
jgi:diadenosine tetraphosphatase ApaH/serine/threonine PP2A family protein phosphatase